MLNQSAMDAKLLRSARRLRKTVSGHLRSPKNWPKYIAVLGAIPYAVGIVPALSSDTARLSGNYFQDGCILLYLLAIVIASITFNALYLSTSMTKGETIPDFRRLALGATLAIAIGSAATFGFVAFCTATRAPLIMAYFAAAIIPAVLAIGLTAATKAELRFTPLTVRRWALMTAPTLVTTELVGFLTWHVTMGNPITTIAISVLATSAIAALILVPAYRGASGLVVTVFASSAIVIIVLSAIPHALSAAPARMKGVGFETMRVRFSSTQGLAKMLHECPTARKLDDTSVSVYVLGRDEHSANIVRFVCATDPNVPDRGREDVAGDVMGAAAV
jgi:hypothetical protein